MLCNILWNGHGVPQNNPILSDEISDTAELLNEIASRGSFQNENAAKLKEEALPSHAFGNVAELKERPSVKLEDTFVDLNEMAFENVARDEDEEQQYPDAVNPEENADYF